MTLLPSSFFLHWTLPINDIIRTPFHLTFIQETDKEFLTTKLNHIVYFPYLLQMRSHTGILQLLDNSFYLSLLDSDPGMLLLSTVRILLHWMHLENILILVAKPCFIVKEPVAFQDIPCFTHNPKCPFAKGDLHLRHLNSDWSNSPTVENFVNFLLQPYDFKQNSIHPSLTLASPKSLSLPLSWEEQTVFHSLKDWKKSEFIVFVHLGGSGQLHVVWKLYF